LIYDPLETEASRKILLELLDEFKLNKSFGLVGGWAVHSLISEDFLRATGREFLRSRDIDVFIDCRGDFPREFTRVVKKIGFAPGEYRFRYTLTLDRDSMIKLSEREAKRKQTFELIYVFLDVLGNAESNAIGVWPNEIVGKIIDEKAMKLLAIDGKRVFVPREDLLLLLKIDSFLQRETKEKRMKDACDIYGLLFYSRTKILDALKKDSWKVERAERGIEAMLGEEILEFIASELFGDRLKSGLVRRNLSQLLGSLT
jgi:hypothetical protein